MRANNLKTRVNCIYDSNQQKTIRVTNKRNGGSRGESVFIDQAITHKSVNYSIAISLGCWQFGTCTNLIQIALQQYYVLL